MSVAASSIPHRAGDLAPWLASQARRLRRVPLALGIILILAAAQGVGWAVATAPWQGPDEIDHFSYAQHLAETGHAPARDGGTGSQSTDELTALLQLNLKSIELHAEGRPNWSSIHRTEAQLAHEPAWKAKNGSGPTSTANYPPLYYAYEAVVYRLSPARSLLGRLYVMRLATVLLLLGSVALAWLVAGELLAARWAQVVATGMVALQPKMGSEGGIVNPDMMLVLFSTACLLASIQLVRAGPSVGRIMWPALFASLGVVTHPRGLFLPPFVVVAIAVALTVTRPRWRALLRSLAVGATVLVVGLVLAVTWTRAHSGPSGGLAYGASNPVAGINPREFLSYVWQFYLPKLTFMNPKVGPDYGYRQFFIETYFGSFASFSVNYRPVVNDMLQLGAGLGLAALYATIAVRWRAVVAGWRVVALAVAFFGSLMALLHIVSYGNLRGATSSGDPVITGRYLLPAIALYGAAIAWVASSLPRRLGVPLAALLLGLSALLAVGGIGISLVRFYG